MPGTKISNLTLTTVGASDETPISRSGSNFKVNLRTAITATLNASNLSALATSTSAQLATLISDNTGSGALVFGTSPTITNANLVTPSLGDATADSINSVSIQTDATSFQFANIIEGLGLQINLTGTTSVTFPTSGTLLSSTSTIIIASGTSGGIPYFSSTSTIGSSAALTNNYLVLGGGAGAAPKVAAGITTDGTSQLNLGVAGASVGKVVFRNATSGSITLEPAAGALGTITLTLPSVSGTVWTSADTSVDGGMGDGAGKAALYGINGGLTAFDFTAISGLTMGAETYPGVIILNNGGVGAGNTVTISLDLIDDDIDLQWPNISGTLTVGSEGGNGAADEGKAAVFGELGGLIASSLVAKTSLDIGGDGDQGSFSLRNIDNSGAILDASGVTDVRTFSFPDASGELAIERAHFYPENYGAVPDGSTNCLSSIQNAIDDCYTAGGGIVQLSQGNYRVNENGSGIAILLKTGVRLQGLGMNATTISTDNAVASNNYCLIAPYGYDTTSTPYGAHELDIADLTLTCTQYTSSAANDRMHNLIGVVNTSKALISRVGFNTTRFHYVEVNYSKNCTIIDCETVGAGNHGAVKFQLDCGGAAGQHSSPRYTATITGSASYGGSGEFVNLTVNSTTGININDHVVITSANGAQAAVYNGLGGFRVVRIVDSTHLVINLGWSTGSPHVSSTATTAGTVTVQPVISGVSILRYKDKTMTDGSIVHDRDFLELSHTIQTGVYRDITVDKCIIVPNTYSVDMAGSKPCIGYDTSALPIEVSNLRITNNTFLGGGHTGYTLILGLNASYSSTYVRRFNNILVENNYVERCGILSFIWVGGIASSDGECLTSLTMLNGEPAQCSYLRHLTVRNNTINLAQRGGTPSTARPCRPFVFGTMDKLICEGNSVIIENRAPENLQTAWTSGGVIGFLFDHVRDCWVHNNSVRIYLNVGTLNSSPATATSCFGFIFGCSAFELSASLTPGYQSWIGNSVYGYSSTGITTDLIIRGFTEIITNGTTGMSSWASATNPSVKGIWSGNRTYSSLGAAVDTWSTHYLSHNTPNDIFPVSTPTTAANVGTWGRHDWWDGQPVYQTFSNAAVTVDPLTTHLLQTGTMSASRVVTLPYARSGRNLVVIDQSGSVTNANTLVLTRAGSDTVNGRTTVTINSPYGVNNLVTNKGVAWSLALAEMKGVTSTATAAGTTVLTSGSTELQVFTGSTTQTVTLPAANLWGAGTTVKFMIKNLSTGLVTINRAGSDTIDSGTSFVLAQNDSIILMSDGVSSWGVF